MGLKGMLLLGHGSTLPYNKDLVEHTAELIAKQSSEYIVKCGYLNMNTPTVGDALNAFKGENIESIVVVPLFLAKGVHILKDIPELIGFAEGQTKGTFNLNGKAIPMVYADPIGTDPLLADLMIKNAAKALQMI